MSALTEAVGRYGAVAAGLVLGTSAKYGLALSDGHAPTVRTVVADLLLLGLLGLMAVTASDWMGLTGNMRVLTGAMVAVSSDRLVRLIRTRFEERVLAAVDVHLPPSEPTKQLIAGPLPAPAVEFDELIRRIDQSDVGK